MERVAHVHGRFQPFHHEHLAYVRWAVAEHAGDRLVVGITNADTAHTEQTDMDPKRHRQRHNPFSYYERHRMIDAALSAADFDATHMVVPFPINRPELWDAYAPADAVHYVNVLEPWHERKCEQLREHGRTVREKRGSRTISGSEIRRDMAAGEPWSDRVPDRVAAFISEYGLEARVRQLYAE